MNNREQSMKVEICEQVKLDVEEQSMNSSCFNSTSRYYFPSDLYMQIVQQPSLQGSQSFLSTWGSYTVQVSKALRRAFLG